MASISLESCLNKQRGLRVQLRLLSCSAGAAVLFRGPPVANQIRQRTFGSSSRQARDIAPANDSHGTSSTAMASSDILSQTLHAVTRIKLKELHRQWSAHESAKRALLSTADGEPDRRKRVKLLLDGAPKIPTMEDLRNSSFVSVENFRRFVDQSARDPSVSELYLGDYEAAMRHELDVQSNKYEFASLYGQLVNEWVSAGETRKSENSDSNVTVGREEMHKQRAAWEDYVFRERLTSEADITAYLDTLFRKLTAEVDKSQKDIKHAFSKLVDGVVKFQEDWDRNNHHFNSDVVTHVIRSMLRSDVLTDSKRTMLRDFLGNDVVISEIADVLNLRMSDRKSFKWEGVATIEQRRQLNGRYRFYPDESDVLQMNLIHYIGLKWAQFIRTRLHAFFRSPGVRKEPESSIGAEAAARRMYFLDREMPSRNLVGYKDALWLNKILLDQLPVTLYEERASYGDDEEKGDDDRKSQAAIMQHLLHLVQTEIIVQTRLGNEVCVLRTDFKWFGPSIPHSSTIAVLRYFGVREDWIDFFKKVLRAPISFLGDDKDVAPRNRTNGTPIGTPLADFFNETMLFVLDFAVNQRANGERLYRLHDDIWLWGGVDTCVDAWASMEEFRKVFGLEWNHEKTGCVRIRRDGGQPPELPSSLPKGDVVWGFLNLDPVSGRFLINNQKVDSHIAELKLQLAACNSVFDFIQAWNIYGVRFFRTNCGKLANCNSRQHVDAILTTFQRVQREVFQATSGSVGEHLKEMLASRFNATDITDGCLYLPLDLGGLELHNPFVEYYLVCDQIIEDVDKVMEKFFEDEEAEYRRAAEAYKKRGSGFHPSSTRETHRHDEPFMSYEEFTRSREHTSERLVGVYDELMREPNARALQCTGDVAIARRQATQLNRTLEPGEDWPLQLYSKETIARFGGLNIVPPGLLPMGLIKMLRQSRFQWSG